jgi:hypothetical protein
MHKVPQCIFAVDLPIRNKPEPSPFADRRVRGKGTLQERARICVDKFCIDELRMAIAARRHMPFGLNVFAIQRAALLIVQAAARVILGPDIVISLGAALETDAHDRTFRVQKPGRLKPEEPRLKGVAVAAGRRDRAQRRLDNRPAADP